MFSKTTSISEESHKILSWSKKKLPQPWGGFLCCTFGNNSSVRTFETPTCLTDNSVTFTITNTKKPSSIYEESHKILSRLKENSHNCGAVSSDVPLKKGKREPMFPCTFRLKNLWFVVGYEDIDRKLSIKHEVATEMARVNRGNRTTETSCPYRHYSSAVCLKNITGNVLRYRKARAVRSSSFDTS